MDLGQDRFGGRHPAKGTGSGVVVLHKVIDFADECSNVGKQSVSNRFLDNDTKGTLWQHGLDSLQCLDLRLLVSTEHDRGSRWIQVRAYSVLHLIHKVGIVVELDGN
ncbi:MAG: hypothetical protein TE42_10615 [Candidatus Synechococcus spongiarum SP3]|uniref:Uncharacterized protein n=1 Tax=Candidatus Synechococcus spongiarum SP3 TaxID=1604020 RepID=A0A0G2HJR9_9SYNE|nr:MAG: hypothetical protein TE42_10615 [Candidatus Synechococcus spongiarum SP3]